MDTARTRRRPPYAAAGKRQRGVVLLIALIALAAMTMAGIAFMRSVDTGSLLAGNLAFNRASVSISDLGLEDARGLVLTLDAASPQCANTGNCTSWTTPAPIGWYRANWQTVGDDYRNLDWGAARTVDPSVGNPDLSGYTIRYIVHRMCQDDGNPVGNTCVAGIVNLTGGSQKGDCDYANCDPQTNASTAQPYYRVTMRVDGPRNTEAYVLVWMI